MSGVLGAPGRAWRGWVAALDRREDAASLAVARMIAGATVAVHLAVTWAAGVPDAAWVDARFGGAMRLDAGWLSFFGGCTPLNVKAALALAIAAAALFALGLFTRVSAVACWFLFKYFGALNNFWGGAYDELIVNALFPLMFSGCGRAWSVDAWLARRRGARTPDACEAPSWPRRLLIAQIVIVYFTTGLHKLSISWVPGGPLDAIWYILQQPSVQRFPMSWAAPFFPLTQAATLVTWFFEVFSPLLLLAMWFRATRERPGRVRAFFNRIRFRESYLALGLFLHLGIEATLEVGPFFYCVLIYYACCIDPAEWRALLRKPSHLSAAALAPRRS